MSPKCFAIIGAVALLAGMLGTPAPVSADELNYSSAFAPGALTVANSQVAMLVSFSNL